MRVTPKSISSAALRSLQTTLAASARTQEQLSSGKQFSTVSQSPVQGSTSMALRTQIRAADQYVRNASDGKGWLDMADTALTDSMSVSQRVRDLTLQGMNTGSMSVESRQAIAAEVNNLRAGLLANANMSYNGRPIFGGTTGEKSAYDQAGAFIGENTPVTRRVSDTNTVRVDLTGPEAFGPAGADIFAIVDQIAKDVVTNPAALGGHLDNLDVAMKRLATASADIGSRTNRIASAQDSATKTLDLLTGQMSENEDIDLPAVVLQNQSRMNAYQAALGVAAKTIQPTLLDFLR
jgi:flagellar hook-associated protein 3 FlgL